jgi:hypothetical protein
VNLTWESQEMISRSAGQGADHAGTAETGDVNGAGDSARGEEDHVYEAGAQAVLGIGAAQSGRPEWTICSDKKTLEKDFGLLKTTVHSGQSCKRGYIVVLGDADRG